MSRKSLIAQVHIAKKDLGLDDDTYWAALEQVTGKTSCSDIDDAGLAKVVSHFKAHGWKPKAASSHHRPKSKKRHVRYIYVLWRELTNAGVTNKNGLNAFVKRQTKTDSVEWLTAAQGNQVIEALKDMSKRHGVNLDR